MESGSYNPADADPQFPSGPWTGYWVAVGCRFRQDLVLEFRRGVMRGGGIDTIGRFEVDGRYDVESKEVGWEKHYVGHYAVQYRGYREGNGIWGTWECAGRKGGFHIWPREDQKDRTVQTQDEIDLEKVLQEILPGIVYG
jgi:hypothetical protein